MEKSCKDPETWGPLLGPALGTRLRLDLSDYEVPSPDLLDAIERAKKAQEKEEKIRRPKGLLTKKQQEELEAELKEKKRPKTQIDYLWAGLNEKNVKATGFALASVGDTFLKGGPFTGGDSAKTESSAGLHYSWLRKHCEFSIKRSTYYSELWVEHGILSTAKLYHKLSVDGGRAAMMKIMNIPDSYSDDLALIEKKVRADISYNITREHQETIDDEIRQQKDEVNAFFADEHDRRAAEKAWCQEFEEDEQMRVEDQRSRIAWDYAYEHNMWGGYHMERVSRHCQAIALDLALRENELMAREAMLSAAIRQEELDRRAYLLTIGRNLHPNVAVSMVRTASVKVEGMLAQAGPPGEAPEKDITMAFVRNKTSVEDLGDNEKHYMAAAEAKDTDWYRLLEEVVAVLVMLERLCNGNAEVCATLGELGVARYVCRCLDMECSKITNIFSIQSRKRSKGAKTLPRKDEADRDDATDMTGVTGG